jgi:hypothetical protein
MVGAHGREFRLHTAEIEVVVALERDVGLAEIRVLEQLGIDRERLANTLASCRPDSAMSFTWSVERISLVVSGKAWAPRSCSG